MEHRHINIKDGQWTVAMIHSIWERGLEADICALIQEVKHNSAAADAVRKAISHSDVYGWPRFFELYLKALYGG